MNNKCYTIKCKSNFEKEMIPNGKHFWQKRKCRLTSKILYTEEHDYFTGLETILTSHKGAMTLFSLNPTSLS